MLTRIASYVTSLDAHLARGRLEAEGIPAFVFHEHHVGLNWPIALAMTEIKVYVHPNDLSRAAEIISAHDRGDFAFDDEAAPVCPRCGNEKIIRRRTSWKSALLVVHLAHIPLPFWWATRKCLHCRYEWDVPNTRAYPLAIPFLVALLFTFFAAVVTYFLLSPYCLDGAKYWLIFPQGHGC